MVEKYSESLNFILGRKLSKDQITFSLNGQNFNLEDRGRDLVATISSNLPYSPILKYQKNIINIKNEAKGSTLMLENIFDFDNFKPIALSKPMTWGEDPFQNRTWQWRLHSLEFASWLIAAHSYSQNIQYIQCLKNLVKDYSLKNIQPNPPSQLSWHDHATALRLENLLCIFQYLSRLDGHDSFLEDLILLIYLHAEVLSLDSFFSKHTNHGIDQCRVLYYASQMFAPIVKASTWYKLAIERLSGEFKQAFSKEGVHVENSPGYHAYVTGIFINLRESLNPEDSQNIFADHNFFVSFNDFVGKAISFIVQVTKPDGSLPIIGDTQAVKPSNYYNDYAHLPQYEHFMYMRSLGKIGNPPLSCDGFFPESGYAIFRDDWHATENYRNTIHIVFKCGYLSQYHRQDDDLSFVLFAYGEDWIVDSGLYNHNQTDPIRKYMRSAFAHNLVLINGVKVCRNLEQVSIAPKITDYGSKSNISWVEGVTRMYDGFESYRKLTYHRPHSILIEDLIEPKTENFKERTFKIQFLVPSNKKVIIDSKSFIIQSPKTKKQMRIKILNDMPCTLRVIQSRKNPKAIGLMSPKLNHLKPVSTLQFVCEGVRLESKLKIKFD